MVLRLCSSSNREFLALWLPQRSSLCTQGGWGCRTRLHCTAPTEPVNSRELPPAASLRPFGVFLPAQTQGNVAHTAKLWLADPRKATAICCGSACPHCSAMAPEKGSQDPCKHGHRFEHWDPHAPWQSHCQPRGAGRGARCTGKTLTMVVSVTEPKLLMKMLHVTLTGGPGKQREASSHHWPGRHMQCTGTCGDAASCTHCAGECTRASPCPLGSPAERAEVSSSMPCQHCSHPCCQAKQAHTGRL